MKPAQCMGCGETAITYMQTSFKLIPTTKCRACGRKVSKRGGPSELFAVLIFAVLILYAGSIAAVRVWFWVGAAIFALYMTCWSWHSVPWDVDQTDPDTS